MDVAYLYRGKLFVWDDQKARANFRKHGVSFETACAVFFDELSVYVDATVSDELRSAVVGFVDSRGHLFVVHLVTESDCTRIISAREATRWERIDYENG